MRGKAPTELSQQFMALEPNRSLVIATRTELNRLRQYAKRHAAKMRARALACGGWKVERVA